MCWKLAGIGLYFRQLLSLAVLCTVYGLITSPTLAYYASSKYDPEHSSGVWFAGQSPVSLNATK
jgi:hypothetical protein